MTESKSLKKEKFDYLWVWTYPKLFSLPLWIELETSALDFAFEFALCRFEQALKHGIE